MARLKLHSLQKTFGSTKVIRGVSLDVKDKEFIVVVGPSGCGKSTLLRMIAGLETVSDGEIQIDGIRANELEPMDRNIAMVFQNYALYPHMSVYNNLAYSLKIAGLAKDTIRERVHNAAKMLRLSEFLERKPRQLSGGQRQRVAMGRAIVREPALFLFDEPLSNLDAKLRVQVRLEIKKLQRKMGVTSIYVTHDQVEAMTMGDRLLVLNAGQVEQTGTPIELYLRPATSFVAQFIGSPSMNLFQATSHDKEVDLAGIKLTTACKHQGDVIVGIRPEHLVRDPTGPLKIQFEAAERLGSTTLYHGYLDQTETPLIACLPEMLRDEEIQNMQTFSVSPSHIHLFSPSGQRIGP